MRTRVAVPVLLSAVLLAACNGGADDDAATGAPDSPSPTTTSPTATTSPPAATGSPAPAESEAPADGEPEFRADASPDMSPADPAAPGLSVVDVRVGDHPGYSRIVFELDGEGTVGWRVQYDDDPRTQGEGAPVDLAGDATLAVVLEGVGYPFDTGIEEYDGPRRFSPDLAAILEVQVGGVYEGYFESFVGTPDRRPFRVFRLDGPQRVVIDVARGD